MGIIEFESLDQKEIELEEYRSGLLGLSKGICDRLENFSSESLAEMFECMRVTIFSIRNEQVKRERYMKLESVNG